MSKGISISSINRIKELAEEKRYAEALEILDTQDLDKSINPQFLRISGEILRKNKCYYDSRRILLKAHQMSPQGTRIISELIQLYLELGYFSLANKYYEEYNFYVGPEDTQKDFVEYIIKKASGADIKELASILIPILERMPEDNWNYEAVLLYDKLGRKDKALDESRFILENFKDSIYTERVIAYIDDELNIDEEFYVYPKEEQEEDVDTFGDLIDLEKEILEKDYLEMYPPEARIMVEVEDKDVIDAKPVKEKKPKKKKVKKSKKGTDSAENSEQESSTDTSSDDKKTEQSGEAEDKIVSASEQKEENPVSDSEQKDEKASSQAGETGGAGQEIQSGDEKVSEDAAATGGETENEETSLSEEELIKKKREEALEKLLSKKFDTEKIKESAKQIADSVKGIDTSKAKSQVKNVTDLVADNVKKASDVLSEAVGTKAAIEDAIQQESYNDPEAIVDGIIENVLEPPKQTVGQVVMNEELDSLVPDSIEAMSADEIADIELKKEEQERLELEALEASVKLEEEKRAKKKRSKSETEDANEEQSLYSELKNKYIEEFATEETAADSLGFITVVHSDVDQVMEENIPDTAQMLRQMIGNKEYYGDENSLGFESRESYHNHGFEIESYDSNANNHTENFIYVKQNYNSDVYKVEDIYVKEPIVSFDDLVPDEIIPMDDYVQSEEWTHRSKKEEEESIISIVNENFEIDNNLLDSFENEKSMTDDGDTDTVYDMDVTAMEETVAKEAADEPEEAGYTDALSSEEISEYTEASDYAEASNGIKEEIATDIEALVEDSVFEPVIGEQLSFEIETPVEKARKERMELRSRIIISESMDKKLLALKETK